MSWPPPTREAHQCFCINEGWQQTRNARGSTGSRHVTFEITLPDGRVMRTRISHPPDRTAYGISVWRHILKDQLDVQESAFWACVNDGVKPSRGMPTPLKEALPAQLVALLIRRVGLPESEVAALTRDEAMTRLDKYWTTGE